MIGKRFRDYRTPPGWTDICGVAMVGLPGGLWVAPGGQHKGLSNWIDNQKFTIQSDFYDIAYSVRFPMYEIGKDYD